MKLENRCFATTIVGRRGRGGAVRLRVSVFGAVYAFEIHLSCIADVVVIGFETI